MLKTNENLYSIRLLSKHFDIKESDIINLIQIKEKRSGIKILLTENYQSYYLPIWIYDKIIESEARLNSLIIDEKIVLEKACNSVPIEVNSYVYFLLFENKVIYIGQTTDILMRISTHKKDKTFDQIACFIIPQSDLLTIETMNIQYYKPKLNKSFINFNLELFRLTLKYTNL